MKKINAILSYFIFWFLWFVNIYIFKIRNRIKIIGQENLPRAKRVFYVSNHQTLIDSLLIGSNVVSLTDLIFRQCRIPWNAPDKNNFFSHKISKHFIKLMKCVPVQRDLKNLSAINKQIGEFCQILKKDNLLIFFEGTRTRDGSIGKCRYGPAKTILQVRPDYIIPILLVGIQPIMPIEIGFKYHKITFGHKGFMIIGPSIDFSDIYNLPLDKYSDKEKLEEIAWRVRNKVMELQMQNLKNPSC